MGWFWPTIDNDVFIPNRESRFPQILKPVLQGLGDDGKGELIPGDFAFAEEPGLKVSTAPSQTRDLPKIFPDVSEDRL